MMAQVLRSFLIPLAGNQLAKSGALQGSVVSWLGASLSPQGIVLGALCEEEDCKRKTSLVLPGGQRLADPSAPRWLFQVLMDGEQPPEDVEYTQMRDGASYQLVARPQLAGYAGGFFVYVLRDISGEPGVTVKKGAATGS